MTLGNVAARVWKNWALEIYCHIVWWGINCLRLKTEDIMHMTQELTGNPDLLRKISTLGLKSRTFNALNAEGCTHVGEMVALSDWGVLNRIRGAGKTTLADIKGGLAKIGLTTEMIEFRIEFRVDISGSDTKEALLREVFQIPAGVKAPTDNLFVTSASGQAPLFGTLSKARGPLSLDF